MARTYDVVTVNRQGHARARPYTSAEPLEPGDLLVLESRFWLVERIESVADTEEERVVTTAARYRLRLRHPDGREELGALRRFRVDAPRLGHAFTSFDEERPISWMVTEERVEHDEQGVPYLDLVAERDYSELESLPDHELEHTMARQLEELPVRAGTFERLREAGLALELVALEPGEEPDWEEAERFIEALILEEIDDELMELCGVPPGAGRQEPGLVTVKQRLRSDLEHFRADVEGDDDEIEVWEFLGGRVFASVGRWEDEADPESAHGWMCRLVDSDALGAAGFVRIRKAELLV